MINHLHWFFLEAQVWPKLIVYYKLSLSWKNYVTHIDSCYENSPEENSTTTAIHCDLAIAVHDSKMQNWLILVADLDN